MSVLFGIANLWCEIILVNDQHKTDRGQYFSVAINPTFAVIESEGDDPINLSHCTDRMCVPPWSLRWRSCVLQPCAPAAILLLLLQGSGWCPGGGSPICFRVTPWDGRAATPGEGRDPLQVPPRKEQPWEWGEPLWCHQRSQNSGITTQFDSPVGFGGSGQLPAHPGAALR